MNEFDWRFDVLFGTTEQLDRVTPLCSIAKSLAKLIIALTPECREQSIALTALETSMMWAIKAIIRRGQQGEIAEMGLARGIE